MASQDPQSTFLSDEQLLAFLDDSLSDQEMRSIEAVLRDAGTPDSIQLSQRLQRLIETRDSGTHSFADVWRRHRLSCPSREDLGRYLLNAMSEDEAAYIEVHIDQVGCSYCQANLEDLERS